MHNGSSKISGSASAPPADPIGIAEDVNPDAFVIPPFMASCYHTQMPLVKHASA